MKKSLPASPWNLDNAKFRVWQSPQGMNGANKSKQATDFSGNGDAGFLFA